MPFIHPTYILAILIAISVHEWAHAITANRLGDDTAAMQGRLTLNPLAHIDPLGALMFLIVGFGWAKPVPVNPLRLRNPKRDMALTALAGPASNLILAFIAFLITLLLTGHAPLFENLLGAQAVQQPLLALALQLCEASIFVNLALMAFNLLPIAPLDGSNILHMFIPWQWEDRYEELMRYGPYLLLALIVLGQIGNLPILSLWIGTIAHAVLQLFTLLVSIV